MTDMTMPELADALEDATGVQAHPDAIGRFLHKPGFTYKKDAGRDRATPRTPKETTRRPVHPPSASSLSPSRVRCLH